MVLQEFGVLGKERKLRVDGRARPRLRRRLRDSIFRSRTAGSPSRVPRCCARSSASRRAVSTNTAARMSETGLRKRRGCYTAQDPMPVDISQLSEDELLELNRRIVERLQFI